MRHVKSARQSAIEKQLTAGLSQEQLQKEREYVAFNLIFQYSTHTFLQLKVFFP